MDIVKLSLRDALEEIASEGVEDARLNDEHAFDIGLYNVHLSDV